MSKTFTHSSVALALMLGSMLMVGSVASADTTEAEDNTNMPHPIPMVGLEFLGKDHKVVMEFLGIFAGKVTAVSGSTITIGNMQDETYTVNASGAAVMRDGESSTLSSITTDDAIIVRGSISGTTITAEKIVANEVPGKAERVVGAVRKIMKDGFKDFRRGLRYGHNKDKSDK